MTESEYWESLRFRINSLPTSTSPRLPALPGWCDWFEPKRYVLDGPSPRITGLVGFVNGRVSSQRRFILLVRRPFTPSLEMEWATLLPLKDSDKWLSYDESGQVIVIDPDSGTGAIAEPGAKDDDGA